MLRCLSGIVGYRIDAVDGEIGKVRDFLFDDVRWTVRYVVVESHHNRVLIPSDVVGRPEWSEQALPVALTVAQVKSLSENGSQPGARRLELGMAEAARLESFPLRGAMVLAEPTREAVGVLELEAGDHRFCSAESVIGRRIRARDGEIGHVYDFIADDDTWSIRYMAVATGDWLPGRKVLLAPEHIESVSPGAKEVAVSLSRSGVKKSPEYDPLEPVNRQYQVRLYDYSGRPSDWE